MADALARRASAGRATPLPSENLDAALQTVELLGLGVQPNTSAVAGAPKSGEQPRDRSGERFGKGMEALLDRGHGPDSSWKGGGSEEDGSSASWGVGGGGADCRDLGWRCFAGRMGRDEAEALLRYNCPWVCRVEFLSSFSAFFVLGRYYAGICLFIVFRSSTWASWCFVCSSRMCFRWPVFE